MHSWTISDERPKLSFKNSIIYNVQQSEFKIPQEVKSRVDFKNTSVRGGINGFNVLDINPEFVDSNNNNYHNVKFILCA